jgi:glycine/D-amino acid oxidase-like deaminating enzyme
LPVFLYELEYGVPYGFPSLDGGRMKIAVHSGGVPLADPLARDRRADRQEQRVAERFLRECLPDVEVPHVDHANCLYTMTPDGHFVVDRHPRHANVAVVAGLSGHGFKFTPVLGEVVADLLTEARSLPIEFLSAARFDRGNTTA